MTKIWCDVVTIYVVHVILGRPWLYDKYVTTLIDQTYVNLSTKEKKIKLLSYPPKAEQAKRKPITAKKPTMIA